jgi:hypothetical protein
MHASPKKPANHPSPAPPLPPRLASIPELPEPGAKFCADAEALTVKTVVCGPEVADSVTVAGAKLQETPAGKGPHAGVSPPA